MRCRHCGVEDSYYNSVEHAQRRSCLVSETGYHEFVSSSWYAVMMVYDRSQTLLNSVWDAAVNSYATRTYVPDVHRD